MIKVVPACRWAVFLGTVLGIGLLGSGMARGAEAVLNGSFENATVAPGQDFLRITRADTITSWSSSGIEYSGRGVAAQGSRYIHLNTSTGGAGSISQSVATRSGVDYAVLFKYSGHPDAAANGVVPALRVIVTGIATSDPFTFDRVVTFDDLQWQRGQFRFRANSTRSTVMFGSFNTGKTTGAFLDEVSVVEASSLPVAPTIARQPESAVVSPGAAVTFTVGANGTQLTYQWTKDGTNLVGATQNTYTLASATVADNGNYAVVVANAGGTVTSANATLSVLAGLPEFTLKLPTNVTVAVGSPMHLEVAATNVGEDGYVWLRQSFGRYVAITGPTNGVYLATNMTANLGGVWAVVASNAVGRVTNTTLVQVIGLPRIATQADEDVRVQVGQGLNFGPKSFSGDNRPYTFQWYKDGVALAGATNQNYMKTAALGDAGTYHLAITNIAGGIVSSNTVVQVFPGPVPAWIRQPLPASIAVEEGTSFTVNVFAAGGLPLHYTWYHDGTVIVAGPNASSYFSNNIPVNASGDYWVVVTNSTGTATSTVERILVYPKQTAPQLAPLNYTTNAVGGQAITLGFTLQQGTLVSYQWFRRVFTNSQNLDLPIANATNLTFTLENPLRTDGGQYILSATNYKGAYNGTVTLNVATPPEFTSQPQSQEAVAGTRINLSANAEPFQPAISYQWLKDGVEIAGATSQNYSFTLAETTSGQYTVRARNDAGTTLSQPAVIAVGTLQPAARAFTLVADRTVAIPQRPGQVFRVVGDGKLRNKVVTFQGTTSFPDIGGLYRWEGGVIQPIADLNSILPGFSGTPTFLEAVTHEDRGLINFLANSTSENKAFLMAWSNGVPVTVLSKGTPMPGSGGRLFERIGYPTRAGATAAFLGFDPIAMTNGPGAYRGLYVWNGATVDKWVDSDGGLPAGDGRWMGNSSQVGFDGSTLAAWLVDGMNNSGIFASVAAGPLRKIAHTGDAIPTGGTFRGFSSPPHVSQGRILFLGQGQDFNDGYLLEHSAAGLRVIARTGAAVEGSAVGLGTPAHSFAYAGDGSILFTANGPGPKSGIYRWRDGRIYPELTSLNSVGGRAIRYAALYDAEGDDCLVTLSFDGSNFGLYVALSGGVTPTRPEVSVARTPNGLRLTWPAGGQLEYTDNLFDWLPSAAKSGDELPFDAAVARFFRVKVAGP